MKLTKQSLTVVSLFMALVLLLAACTVPTAPTAPADTEAPAEPAAEGEATAEATEEAAEEPAGEAPAAIMVGLITDVGRINDRSFNQSAWQGVLNYAEAAGLSEDEYRYIETQAATDYADNIQQFIDAGFPVIVTVGFALGEATTIAAQENPDIMFIGVDQFQAETLPNVVGLSDLPRGSIGLLGGRIGRAPDRERNHCRRLGN
jgi:basic membrane protein A